ncbi:MAG: V-type ATP synthase subunit I [Methanomicrobiales archaeon]|nr:V-type ATP synthase subunit I [Methanomicrobiales archaeon]
MLQRMTNVLVVGPKNDYQEIIDVLYQEGTVHLQDATESFPQLNEVFRPMESTTQVDLTLLLVKINGIYQILPRMPENRQEQDRIYQELHLKSATELISVISSEIGELESRTRALAGRKGDLELSKTALERYEKIIEKIQPLESQIPLLEGFEVTVLLIQKEFRDVLEPIRSVLKNITRNQFEFIAADLDEQTTAVITVFNKKFSEQVHSFLFSQNVNEVRIPEDYANMPLPKAIALIGRKKLEIDEEMATIDQDLASLSSVFYQKLSVFQRILEDREKELQAFAHFGQSDNTILVRGWVPRKYLKRTKAAMKETFGGRVVMTEMDVPSEEMEYAPAFYDNPRWVRPFEFFNRLITPPKYMEIDPSPFIAIFFPIFFGVIVGDIGYGLCILGFAIVMKLYFKKLEWLKQLMNILIISSISTIFFGFLYGEFFGNFGEEMGWLHPVTIGGVTLNRIEAMIPLLIFSIVLGILHVSIGLGIGMLNAYYRKSKKHFCEKCGMLAMIIGIILLVLVFAELIPGAFLLAGIFVIIAALPVLLYGGGVRGAIEIAGTMGNILSYARIMALGMASVILALVANELAGAVGIVAVGVLIAVLLHSLNIILGMFSPSIHSMRLHLVEFYSKFYEGGGELYRPFGREKET